MPDFQSALAQPVAQPTTKPLLVRVPTNSGPNPSPPNNARKIFPEQRTFAVQDHQTRNAGLEKVQRCLAAVANAEHLSDCMRQKGDTRVTQRR